MGGLLEEGEDPSLAAQRELQEEMGYKVRELVSLGSYAVDGNRGAGVAHLFLGVGAVPTTQTESDDLEEMKLLRLSEQELRAALFRGDFKLLSWSHCISLGLMRYQLGRTNGEWPPVEDEPDQSLHVNVLVVKDEVVNGYHHDGSEVSAWDPQLSPSS